ncbi:MAG: hypothetical protein F4218_07165 [Synechococcus sp. SB0677_bin_5]|nr:hypothetical protein [Synechococcus sp. SB0677_bin_5]
MTPVAKVVAKAMMVTTTIGSNQRRRHAAQDVVTAEGAALAGGWSLGLEGLDAGVVEVIGQCMGHGLHPHGSHSLGGSPPMHGRWGE